MATNADLEVLISANSEMVTKGMNNATSKIQEAVSDIQKSLKRIEETGEDTNQRLQKSFGGIGEAFENMKKKLAVAFGGFKAAQLIQDSTLLAARYETLGIVLTNIGSNAGYTTAEVNKAAEALQDGGISMIESRQQAVRLMQANIDLTHSTKLARIAQDAAVIANTNSSDAFSRLVNGIQTAQVEVLRNIGINVSMEKSYKRMADNLGVTVDALSQTQKTQSILNSVFESGKVIAGTYEAAMQTAGKQIGSMARLWEDLKVKMGEAFLPTLTQGVIALNQAFKAAEPIIDGAVVVIQQGLRVVIELIKTLWAVAEPILKLLGEAFTMVGDIINSVFGNEGSAAINIFMALMKELQSLIIGFRVSFQIAFEIIKTSIQETILVALTFADVATSALKLDFDGAKSAWKNGSAQITDVFRGMTTNILSIAEKGKSDLDAVWSKPVEAEVIAKDPNDVRGGNEGNKKKPATSGSIVSKWKDELEALKVNEGEYFKSSLEMEIEFWSKKLETTKSGSKERLAVERELFALRKTQAKEELTSQLVALENEIANEKDNLGKKVILLKEEADLIKSAYGDRSKEHLAMLQKIIQAEGAFESQRKVLIAEGINTQKELDLLGVQSKEDALAYRRELGDINGVEEVRMQREIAEETYRIEYKAAQQQAELITDNVVKRQKAYDKLVIMAEAHAKDIEKINDKEILAQKKKWDGILEPIGNTIDKSITGIIKGTTSFKKVIDDLLQNVILSFANMGVKIVIDWVAKQFALTAATQAGVTARAAAEQQGAAAGLAAQAATALKAIGNYAIETFAAIYKSISAIPIIGPFLAPAAAAGGMAVVAGVAGSVMSAEGGYDIPAGVNPMTQLHEKEMVLPKKQADTIRNLDEGKFGSQGQQVNVNITAMDAKSVKDLFKKHPDILTGGLRRTERNFGAGKRNRSRMGRT